MNRYHKALTKAQTRDHQLDVNQHAPQHIRLGFIENYLFDEKRDTGCNWVQLDELVEVMKQSKPNVIRLVRILENQGRIVTMKYGKNTSDDTGPKCLWMTIIKSK